MIIGITGGTGFVGQAVTNELSHHGDEVILFSRKARGKSRKFSLSEPLDVSGCDGLVHLAGESIIGLWTRAKRRRILESRLEGTRRVVEGIAAAVVKPRVLVSASAIGFYGDTGDTIADEDSPAGRGFLSEVAQAWEVEAQKAEELGVRVVRVRIGFVLGQGGAMKLIGPLFHAGLGGKLGSGTQWMSCIEVEDLAAIIGECLQNAALSGVVNAVMPEAVTNDEFTRAIAAALHRPAILPAPAWGLRLALGDLSHLLLDSQRIVPKRLTSDRFRYRYPTVDAAMERLFGPTLPTS
jgi:uncharacterized protein (TIGR01777 family)